MKFQLTALVATLLGAAAQPAPPQVAPADLLRVMRLEPGRWRTSGRVLDLQVMPARPGATLGPGAAEAARARIGMTQTSESCIGTGLAADGAWCCPG